MSSANGQIESIKNMAVAAELDSSEVDCSIFVEKFHFPGDVVVTGKKTLLFFLRKSGFSKKF